jgi:hypothetical protein
MLPQRKASDRGDVASLAGGPFLPILSVSDPPLFSFVSFPGYPLDRYLSL